MNLANIIFTHFVQNVPDVGEINWHKEFASWRAYISGAENPFYSVSGYRFPLESQLDEAERDFRRLMKETPPIA